MAEVLRTFLGFYSDFASDYWRSVGRISPHQDSELVEQPGPFELLGTGGQCISCHLNAP